MLNINATEKERAMQAAEARKESRRDVIRTILFACLVTFLFFLPYYVVTGSWKGAIALPAFLALCVLFKGRARRFVFDAWRNR